MAQITSSVGLISGINTGAIINELMAIEQEPVNQLQARVNNLAEQKAAYNALTTSLTSLQSNGQTLAKASTFENTTATSSDDTVATATTTTGAAAGSYQIQVAQLVTTQQLVSQGYADPNNTKLSAGTITIGMGGGELNTTNDLSTLNGGAGVEQGEFRITDRSGASTLIDTTGSVTLQDVVNKINTAADVQVKATLQDNHIVLTDLTGKTANDLTVTDIGDTQTAQDLGIAGNSAGTNTITGTSIDYITQSTTLSSLNDGNGVSTNTDGGGDFTIQPSSGGPITVSLATATTVGDVINAINTAAAGKVTASINPDGDGIQLTDAGNGSISVTAIGDSQAAQDLGLASHSSVGTLDGDPLVASLGSVLVSSLNGGQGFDLGTISIKDRASSTAVNVDLSGAKSVQDILDDINNSGAGVQASITTAGDAIQIQDTSGGTGDLQIGDSGGGTTAEDLGINGDFDTSTSVVKGADLNRQYVSAHTLLSNFNGGKGVSQGSFTITNSKGLSQTISVGTSQVTLGDVINQINARDMGVTASINKEGNGIALTDTAAGTGTMTVADVNGTTAQDLNLTGTATNNVIDGGEEKTIQVTANDTLSTLQQKINNLDFGVTASIINDGTADAPFRLSITANNSGLNGRVIFDDGTTGLGTQTLVQAQNAAVFIGGSGAAQPLLITSSSNQISNAIKGVTISLNGVSANPVTLNISSDPSAASTQITQFVTTYNALMTNIGTLTSFNTNNNTAALLLGDNTTQQIQDDLFAAIGTVVPNNGNYETLESIGISVDQNGQLSFDQDTFNAAYAANPTEVQNLFTAVNTVTDPVTKKTTTTNVGLGGVISDEITKLIDPVTGAITMENQTIDNQTSDFNDQISQLNDLIEQKRERLEEQFANMESVLAGLQSQQSALGTISKISTPTSSSSTTKSS